MNAHVVCELDSRSLGSHSRFYTGRTERLGLEHRVVARGAYKWPQDIFFLLVTGELLKVLCLEGIPGKYALLEKTLLLAES